MRWSLLFLSAAQSNGTHSCQCSQHDGRPQNGVGLIPCLHRGLLAVLVFVLVVTGTGRSVLSRVYRALRLWCGRTAIGWFCRRGWFFRFIGAISRLFRIFCITARLLSRCIFFHRIKIQIRHAENIPSVGVVVVIDSDSGGAVNQISVRGACQLDPVSKSLSGRAGFGNRSSAFQIRSATEIVPFPLTAFRSDRCNSFPSPGPYRSALHRLAGTPFLSR